MLFDFDINVFVLYFNSLFAQQHSLKTTRVIGHITVSHNSFRHSPKSDPIWFKTGHVQLLAPFMHIHNFYLM